LWPQRQDGDSFRHLLVGLYWRKHKRREKDDNRAPEFLSVAGISEEKEDKQLKTADYFD